MARITIDIPDYYDLDMIMGHYTRYDRHIIKLLDLYEIDADTGEPVFTCPIFDFFVDKEFDVQLPFVSFTPDGPIVQQPLDIGKFKRGGLA